MTPLNSRLKLALINRQKQGNPLQEGFTLVELMIVIVIVGILSAVALPTFLAQTDKAKASECTTKLGTILSVVSAEHLLSADDAFALLTSEITTADTNAVFCDFAAVTTAAPTTTGVYELTAIGTGDIADNYAARACVNGNTGARDINTLTGPDVGLTASGTTLAPAAVSCT